MSIIIIITIMIIPFTAKSVFIAAIIMPHSQSTVKPVIMGIIKISHTVMPVIITHAPVIKAKFIITLTV